MKNTLVHAETTSALTEITNWGQRQIELLKTQIAPGCNDEELIFFGQVCSRTKLDPFRKQIYAIPRYDGSLNSGKGGYKMSIQTGIDGLRAIASRTGQYAGSDEPLFDEGLNLYQHKESGRKRPTVAKVTVWKIVQGQRCSFTGIALWDEFVQTTKNGQPNSMWNRMGYNQLAKCFSADTQVLTTNGFEYFHSVTGQILQVTGVGLEPTDSKPFVQPYFGEMLQVDGDTLNFSVTPNHDMVTTFGKVEAAAMYLTTPIGRTLWRIPMSASGSFIDYPVSDEQLRLAGYVLADGYRQGSRWLVSCSRPYKVDALRNSRPLNEGVRHSRGDIAVTVNRQIRSNFDKAVFTFESERIAALVDDKKRLNIETLVQLSQRQARLLMDAWQAFDGHTNKKTGVRRIYTSRQDHLKAIEVLAVVAGYSINSPRKRTSDISDRENFYLTISEPPPQPVNKPIQGRPGMIWTPNQNGEVWCVTVPSGRIVVRRNGFSMVCGNCAEAAALRKAFPEEVGDISLGEAQDDFGGDRTPIDYMESETWLKFTDAIQRAEMDNEPTEKLKVLEDWIYRQVSKGKLPKIAENSIERELKNARERIRTRMGMPKGKQQMTQGASEPVTQSTEDQEIIDYLKTVPVTTTAVQTPLLEDDQW